MLPLSAIDYDEEKQKAAAVEQKSKTIAARGETIETLRYVHRSSNEFKSFIKKLEMNYDGSNKLSACLLCWGFLTGYQKKKHLEHAHYTITPSFFRTEQMYIKHAKLHNKMKDSDTMVALLNESCKILIGNPYMQGPSIQRPISITPPAGVIQ